MANIMINDYCNLNCSYCFAKNVYSKTKMNISMENFQRAVDFIFNDNTEQLGIIGGEPTLHPYFGELMQLLDEDDRIRDVMIFTNGLNMCRMKDLLLSNKFKTLLNLNNPLYIGEEYDKICWEVKKLQKIKPDLSEKIGIGINIYEKKVYHYWIDFMKEFGLKYVRLSLVIPIQKMSIAPRIYHQLYLETLQNYINMALDNDIIPFFDCNVTPPCLFSDEYKGELLEKFRYKPTNILGGKASCFPVIDILPNLNAIRCFGTSEFSRENLENHGNIHELRQYYIKKIDSRLLNTTLDSKCVKCEWKKLKKCSSGCYGIIMREDNLSV